LYLILLSKKIESLQPRGEYGSFNINSLCDKMVEKYPEILRCEPGSSVELDYVYRLIFIYSRSDVVPHFKDRNKAQTFFDRPIVYFDTLYLHKPSSGENPLPQKIYDFLSEIRRSDKEFYHFENSTSTTKFFSSVTTLLAHPLQRPTDQSQFNTVLQNE